MAHDQLTSASDCSEVALDQLGMVPSSWLKLRSRRFNCWLCKRSAGMVPVKRAMRLTRIHGRQHGKSARQIGVAPVSLQANCGAKQPGKHANTVQSTCKTCSKQMCTAAQPDNAKAQGISTSKRSSSTRAARRRHSQSPVKLHEFKLTKVRPVASAKAAGMVPVMLGLPAVTAARQHSPSLP